ncbi:MAG TPA: MarR family transcriptional regulator [Xanthobacteraceae bacterium]|nr:MarR family transcriptional regulator [Xanthobacteraceae bacterium]
MKAGRRRAAIRSEGRLRLDLPNYVPYRITSLAALIRRAFAQIYRDDPGLNEPEWKVMTTLAHYGPLPSGDIGHYVTLDRVAVSRALARLIKLGLVTRARNDADQRTFLVDLTPRAARVYDRMAADALAIEERVLTALDEDEVRSLLALLDKVEGCFLSPADQRRVRLMHAARSAVDQGAGRAGRKGRKRSAVR